MTANVASRLAALTCEPLDVLIVGGGIVGSGVARDAAMRGLRVGLVDRFDFAFGTSSRSSRLLHGGLRYLAQGRIGLVREASIEKVILHRIAPHLAAPLPFIFPTRRGTDWAHWKLRVGVKLYDLLCSGRNLGKSSSLDSNETLAALPMLNPTDLTGAVRYFDGQTNDARLVLDTLRSAAANGAILVNYAAMQQSKREGDLWKAQITDSMTGESAEVSARCIVNAAGAWADRFPESRTKLRLTKGVHLVIDRSRLPIPDAVVMTQGNRILFAIPWGDRVILGTTDTDYTGNPDSPTCDPEDVRYILQVTNDNFPAAKIEMADIISTWVGLRPLIDSGGGSNTGRPSDISRKHLIQMTDPGWFDVAGGKLTTYRHMAEETLDQIVKFLKINAKPCRTADVPLVEDASFSAVIPPPLSEEAVIHFCRNEWVIHLDDVMIRRTGWRHYHRDHLAIAHEVAKWMAKLLGWDSERLQNEIQTYQTETTILCIPNAD
jgi:glycerol-3-phosphate dehydrogenase